MSSHSYNRNNPNAQPNSPMSGHRSQGSEGSHPLSSPAYGPSRSGPPLPDDGTGRFYQPPGYPGSQSGPHPLDDGTGRHYPPPRYSGSQSGRHPPDDGTGWHYQPPGYPDSQSGRHPPDDGIGRHYPPPRYSGSQSGLHPPDDGTGRYYPPGYFPQNTVSHQVVTPRREDLSPPTPYNLYTTPHGTPLPAHGTSKSGPLLPDPPNRSPNPGPSRAKQSGPLVPSSGGGGAKRRLLSMIQYTLNQPVQVRINANTWVVGIIVGVVNLTGLFSGSNYKVEYESTGGRRDIGEFSPEDIAPK